MKAIVNGKLILPQEILTGQTLLFDTRIRRIASLKKEALPAGTEYIDAKGQYVSPGFINLHIHGIGGSDTMDGMEEALKQMCRILPATGVTGFLPTSMTETEEKIRAALANIAACTEKHFPGAEILGANMEGPFISTTYKGSQEASNIQKANWALVAPYAGCIKIITLAPESLPDPAAFIRRCRENGILVSLGHSNATYDEAAAAYAAGASHITHLFNAMRPFHHREPGLAGAALTLPFICELICDGIHIHPAAIALAVKAKGPDGVVLVTDSLRACLIGDGESELGGHKVCVKGLRATLQDGTLAASVLPMHLGVKNLKEFTHLSLPEAVRTASLNPAEELGLHDRGSLAEGKRADLVLFNEAFAISRTYVKGACVYQH